MHPYNKVGIEYSICERCTYRTSNIENITPVIINICGNMETRNLCYACRKEYMKIIGKFLRNE
jgi:hypothetical protein